MSDHQLIYCTRKTARIKSSCNKSITFHFLKSFSPEVYKEARKKFSNYELFDDIDEDYQNFIQKVMAGTDNFAPSIDKRVKGTSQD